MHLHGPALGKHHPQQSGWQRSPTQLSSCHNSYPAQVRSQCTPKCHDMSRPGRTLRPNQDKRSSRSHGYTHSKLSNKLFDTCCGGRGTPPTTWPHGSHHHTLFSHNHPKAGVGIEHQTMGSDHSTQLNGHTGSPPTVPAGQSSHQDCPNRQCLA